MIINKFLQKFSLEYQSNKDISSLIEFTSKTLPNDGTDKLFIGCVLILFDQGFIGPSACHEYLYSIVKSGTDKIGNTNILAFYLERINTNKLVSKYLKDVINDKNISKYLNLVLEYLDQFNYDFSISIKKQYQDKIKDYII